MANVMSVEKRNTILRLLVEGNSIRSTCRLMQTCIPSVLRQLVWAGDHSAELMDSRFRGLRLDHLGCDEIWTFCRKKQAQLTTTERELASDIGDIYLWTAFDQQTKLVAAHVVGKRSADMARRLMMKLAGRLEFPAPHLADARNFQPGHFEPITQISSDGFQAYPEAVDLAIGPYVKFGTLIKDYRNADQPGRYSPGEIVGTQRRSVFNMSDSDQWSICTSHVERHNLTIRTFMKRFARLALGFSKKLANLEAAINLYLAYYNFCWRTRYPDHSGKCGRYRATAAMMAGVTDRLWTFNDLMSGGPM